VTTRRNDGILRLIAVFKFFKATVLIAAGMGALELLRPSAAAQAQAWAGGLATMYNERLNRVLATVTGLSDRRLRAFGVIAFLYAAVFLVEGTGLWLGRRWAEYFTVIVTASLIPFEIYELIKRQTPLRIGALVINLGVLVYLVYRLRRDRPRHGVAAHA
jgi:uncharacterized membrane protein (DUF2068 family)